MENKWRTQESIIQEMWDPMKRLNLWIKRIDEEEQSQVNGPELQQDSNTAKLRKGMPRQIEEAHITPNTKNQKRKSYGTWLEYRVYRINKVHWKRRERKL